MTSCALPDPCCPAIHGQLALLLPHVSLDALEGKHILLSGGTGFFGYWLLSLLDLLNRQGLHVEVSVLSRNPAAFLARAPFFSGSTWLKWLKGDVKTFPKSGPADLMIHAATETSAAAHARPLMIMDDVLLGTRHALQRALNSEIGRILFVSSGAVYGTQSATVQQITEDTTSACDSMAPASAYGEAKRAAEQWCVQFGLVHGVDIPVARCFAFVGAGLPLNGHFAIGNFILDALENRPIHANGDGTPVRSYLYGADLALWLLQILLHGSHGRAYNVGADQGLSIAAVAHAVRDALAPHLAIQITQTAPSSALRSRYVPSIQRARDELGLDVWTPLATAIRMTADSACLRPQ
ncbi:MAG: NAD(P)-dependent oxidoreductase [Thauera sp.]|jgi:nucleoside-diphosphate-sugar epimerase